MILIISSIDLSNQFNNTTSSLDLFFGQLGDESSLDDDWDIWDSTLTQNLTVTGSQGVNDWSSRLGSRLQVFFSLFFWDQSPQLVQVQDWLPEMSLLLVEVSHTDLTEVTWMVLIQVGSVVVQTTSHTSTTGMLSVLTDTTFTGCLKWRLNYK
uniref:YGL102C-like protein n=1 Tax=Kluyveromyces lactis TaxID=28985 RepID=Q8J288_KLULC|nr:YGL102C-like protein [Kluyveromyces lactis]